MLQKSIDILTKADIEALVTDAVSEQKTIEYKEALPGGGDGDKKEFLADISSFANAAGGWVFYGIAEQRDQNGKTTGIPTAANGIAGVTADQEVRRLEQMMREGVSPRLPGTRVRAIEGFRNGPVFVIHVPQSWSPPHMVTFRGSQQFHTRASTGKYPMDVAEIRAAAVLSESLPETIRNFRSERLGKIVAGDTPVPVRPGPKVVLHMMPVSAFRMGSRFDLGALDGLPGEASPISSHGYNRRINFDGLVNHSAARDESSIGYVQFYRSGTVEAVDTALFGRAQDGRLLITSIGIEQKLISAVTRYLKIQKQLGVEVPIVIVASLLGVKGYQMAVDSFRFGHNGDTIDRNDLLLPDVVIESFDSECDRTLRPLLDSIWNACGWDGSPHFNADGKWAGDGRR